MLGYGKDSHTYRVFNTYHHKVVEIVDVRFDETNGSHREHLPPVLEEMPPKDPLSSRPLRTSYPLKNMV